MYDAFAFGEVAQAQARFYEPAGRPLLIASGENIAQALLKAVELRTLGQQFDVAFVLREQQTVHALNFGKEILRFSHDFDQRRNAFELLARMQLEFGGKKQAEIGQLSAPIWKTLCDIAGLANRFVVGSWEEYRRIVRLLGVHRPVVRAVHGDSNIPAVRPDSNADAIVVWAPEQNPESLAAVLFALEEFRRPAYVVCRPGPTYGLKAMLVGLSECERALSRAALVVDPSVDTPAAALTFLENGLRVVATRQSGAIEYAPRLRVFDPWSRRSVFGALAAAVAEPAARCTRPTSRPASSPAVAKRESVPKVSLVVRTYDRPRLLERSLRSLQAQTYPNLEGIVVNNGGDPVVNGEICSRFERVRMMSIERSDIAVAATLGFTEATGVYGGLLDDDDALFPDHVERLSDALMRSGCRAAYADALNTYLRRVSKNIAIAGYGAVFVPAIEPVTMLFVCQVVGSCRMLFDRRWVLQTGGFKEEFAPADDYEVWLRILAESDLVRVPAITALYTQFLDNESNISNSRGADYVRAHEAIYERYPTERATVRLRRDQFLEQIREIGGLARPFAPLTLDPQPLLF